MMKIGTFISTIVGLVIFATGCDRTACNNANPIFDEFSPGTKEYKEELAKQLTKVDKSKLSYWMDTYQEHNGRQSILAKIQGDGLCAKILLVVKESRKGIEAIVTNKGVGYSGAELKNLKFDIKQDGVSTEFLFQEITGIVD